MAAPDARLSVAITCYPTFGGSGVIATELGVALARRGHRIHFISYEVPVRLDRFVDNVVFHEVELRDHPVLRESPYVLALASKMVDVTRHHGIDVFHVHYAVPHAASAYLARQILGADAPKVVTTLHGTDITLVGSDPSFLPITRFSILQSDAVTVPSRYLRDATRERLDVPEDFPIDVIENFVDTARFCPPPDGLRPRLPALLHAHGRTSTQTDGRPLLAHVSNFRAVKRIDDVIRIFAQVRRQLPATLALVGDGPERSRAEALVRELGLEADVCFLGKQHGFVELLQASQVFLLPSASESFGLAALEALACGVPVVGSNSGGLPEVVTHEITGYLAPVGDVAAMSAAALRLLGDPALAARMSRAARADVERRFPLERAVDAYEARYRRALG